MGQQVNVYDKLVFQPGAHVTGAWNGSYDTGGRTYYVNNITGGANADGLSWNSAFDQLDTAVTASEAYRALGGRKSAVDTNDYIRNRIVLQGTGTTYEAVDALPNWCDVIGLGAVPFGDGYGIVVLGDNTGSSDGLAGEVRGSNFYNIQFIAEGAFYAVDLAVAYRTSFDTCAFGSNATASACAIAFNVVSAGGLILRGCRTIGHLAFPVIGYAFSTAGGNFNECLVEYCSAVASTTGMTNVGELNNGTVIRNNIIYGGTTGITDTSSGTDDTHKAFYWNNFASSESTGMTMTNRAERHCMNNYSVAGNTSAIYYALG